jgi:hypothetical protein
MAETYRWIDRGTERVLWLDAPEQPGARYLAVRPQPGGDDEWFAACRLAPGEAEQEVGDRLAGARVAEDVILKYAIKALAQAHGVSSAPGLPDEDAGEAEVAIARLWRVLTERWAPPGAT